MNRVFLSLVLIVLVSQACVKSKTKEIQVVTADEVKSNIKYADKSEIKTKEDFKNSHLINAENIINNKSLRDSLNKLDKNSPIAVYFTSENKSQEAVLILKEIGFKQIYILDGGIKKYTSENNIAK